METQNQQPNEKKYNYFYKTTNLLNGKYYYGIHSTDNLEDGYMGSGRALKRAFKKYSRENFTKEIISNFSTRHEASEHERQIVTLELIQLKECYNCRTGGDNSYIYIYSEETRKKMSIAHSGVNNPFYGKTHSPETKKKITGEKNSMFGKHHTEDAKKRIGEAQKGEKNTNYGKPLPESTKEKLRNQSYCKPCIILGIIYISIKEAVRQLNMPENTVRNRIYSKNIKFKDWNYVQ